MPSRDIWGAAFAKQARSDWHIYQHLAAEVDSPDCHTLHYLQMACEKIAKAYRIRDLDSDINELMKHHGGFVRFVRAFLLSPTLKSEYEHRSAQLRALMRSMSNLAREIERLAPAADGADRPDNAEYPWPAGATVVAPCEYDFPNLSLLTAPRGRALLKLVRRAMDEFENVHIT